MGSQERKIKKDKKKKDKDKDRDRERERSLKKEKKHKEREKEREKERDIREQDKDKDFDNEKQKIYEKDSEQIEKFKERNNEIDEDKFKVDIDKKDKTKEKEKEKEKEKNKDKDKKKDQEKYYEQGKQKEKEKQKEQDLQKEKDRDRDRDNEKVKDKQKFQQKEQEQDFNRDNVNDKDQLVEQLKNQDQDQDQDKYKERESDKQIKDKDKDKDRDREKKKEKIKDRERDNQKTLKEKDREHKEKEKDKKIDKERAKEKEKEKEKNKNKERERERDKDKQKQLDEEKHLTRKTKFSMLPVEQQIIKEDEDKSSSVKLIKKGLDDNKNKRNSQSPNISLQKKIKLESGFDSPPKPIVEKVDIQEQLSKILPPPIQIPNVNLNNLQNLTGLNQLPNFSNLLNNPNIPSNGTTGPNMSNINIIPNLPNPAANLQSIPNIPNLTVPNNYQFGGFENLIPVDPLKNPIAALEALQQMNPLYMMQKMQMMRAQSDVKADRKLYVGNLPPNTSQLELQEFLNQTILKMGVNMDPGPCIVNTWINSDGHFGFVEFRTPEEATQGFCLNNVVFNGMPLKIGRPKSFLTQLQQANQQINSDAPCVNILGNLKAESVEASNFQPLLLKPRTIQIPTPILMLHNVLTLDDLTIDEEYNDIVEDIKEECEKYGKIQCVIIPRPADGIDPKDIMGLGKIIAQYSNTNESRWARKNLHGRLYMDRTVEISYLSEDRFKKGEYIEIQ